LLPTLIFILGAYLSYALISAWPKRSGVPGRSRGRWRRFGWITLAGAVGSGSALLLWLSLSPAQKQQNLKMEGFMGTVWADGVMGESPRPLEYPMAKTQAPGDHPVYALLHPETPEGGLGQGKPPVAHRSLKKPRPHNLATSQGKGGKALAQSAKKEKVTAKTRPKKKKTVSSPGSPKATSG
jgi:hypothetical protein